MAQRIQAIEEIVGRLRAGQVVPAAQWPSASSLQPEELGLSRADGLLCWQQAPDFLTLEPICTALPDLTIELAGIVGSTNTMLMERAARGPIAGQLILAEMQTAGRGRRGRDWRSPYARNLSMTLGVGFERPLSALGGLSLVVGIAIAGALEELGVERPMLKWPNDVLIEGHKICGVLVELTQHQVTAQVAIGIGVNVQLSDAEIAQIGQPVTDLRRQGVVENRSQLVATLITAVREHLALFDEQGFEPFIPVFNAVHCFQGRKCQIISPTKRVTGVVSGVGEQGELILQTSGEEQRFHGGEVSLRAGDAPTESSNT